MISTHFNFTRQDHFFFIIGGILICMGLAFMYFDPAEYGFGVLTLTIAPISLLAGTLFLILGILGWDNIIHQRYNFLSLRSPKKWTIDAWVGAGVFSISLYIYIITLEPTASLWDCSEFIACAYKLQISHTPGAPLFVLIGRMFTMLAFGNVETVAWWMNFMSALASAGATLLMYKIIWVLGYRLIVKSGSQQNFSLIIAASCGSLAMAFCDTFWFSAVEAETYASASFFILWLLFLGLKWFYTESEELAKRSMLFIFFLLSLSYSIHPMCLLVIPPIILLWYLKNKNVNGKNVLIGIGLGFVLLLFINRIVAVGIFEASFYLDKILVNNFGLPFCSGAVFFIAMVTLGVYTLVKKLPQYNLIYWIAVFLMIGFWPYIMLSIRSAKNPPIDEGNPENLAALTTYIKRESYGSRPLIYGQYFDSDITDTKVSGTAYYKAENQYQVAGKKLKYIYDEKRQTFLPRLYSNDKEHIANYRNWTSLKVGQKPEFKHNIEFLFKYQLGHMWFRYLMWNFSGRASDVQHADWLMAIDGLREQSPTQQNNKANNQYWMIPFLIGIVGLAFQYKYDKKGFLFSLSFFLTMGVILSLYLNSPPQEPRERDYIYVGSIIAYCIWIGLGILSVHAFLSKYKRSQQLNGTIISVLSFLVVGLLLWQNYDDHDRSGRTLQIEHARNILESCAPNALLFTGGDNDTFPLWYLQEVEGVRTDVRVIVLSYFNSDWYINQNQQKHYQSEPLPISFDNKYYRQYGPNDVIYINNGNEKEMMINAKKLVKLIKEDHPALRVQSRNGNFYHQIPSGLINVPTDPSQIDESQLPSNLKGNLVKNMLLRVKGNYLEKNALMLLDILLTNDWERPIYFNYTSLNSIGFDVMPYVAQEGLLFRLLPIKNNTQDILINRSLMYENLIEKANYPNFNDEDIYFNYEDFYLRIILPVRQGFVMLAASFLEHNNEEKAAEVASFAFERFYPDHLPLSSMANNLSGILKALNKNEEAKILAERFYDQEYRSAVYALEKDQSITQQMLSNLNRSARILRELGEEHYYTEWTNIMNRVKNNEN